MAEYRIMAAVKVLALAIASIVIGYTLIKC